MLLRRLLLELLLLEAWPRVRLPSVPLPRGGYLRMREASLSSRWRCSTKCSLRLSRRAGISQRGASRRGVSQERLWSLNRRREPPPFLPPPSLRSLLPPKELGPNPPPQPTLPIRPPPTDLRAVQAPMAPRGPRAPPRSNAPTLLSAPTPQHLPPRSTRCRKP